MPGPGGGGRGGGFSGGSRGGGFGGGFGGGYRPPTHHHYHRPFFGFFPRPFFGFGYGGGCLGGLFSIFLTPVLIIAFAAIMIFSVFSSSFSNIANGGTAVSNQQEIQTYASVEYEKVFGSYDGYENNILIVFLANEDADGYDCIAWVGHNIVDEIDYMFGDDTTEFGRAMLNSIDSDYYKFSLDSNLVSAVRIMKNKITSLGIESFYEPPLAHSGVKSQLNNYTDISMSRELVEKELKDFTDKTGIPIAISVDTVEKVYGKGLSGIDIVVLIICVGFIGLGIYLIIKAIKNRRGGNSGGPQQQGPYTYGGGAGTYGSSGNYGGYYRN